MTDNQAIFKEIMDEIKRYSTIIIHRHVRPDPDAIGSQAGLAELLKSSFPEKEILKAGSSAGDLSFLAEMDVVKDEAYKDALVIVTDTANRPRISDQRYKTGDKLIKIDHHPNEDVYGELWYVNTAASSTCEIIADFYSSQSTSLVMTSETARLLYAGIIGDTGRFLYPATTPHTMRVAADLMEHEFHSEDLNRKLDSTSLKAARLSGHVLQTIQISPVGVGSVILTKELMEEFQVNDAETAAVVPLPGSIEETLAWGIFVEQPEGGYRCRLRSKGPIINEIAKEHGGGGHPLASGAKAKDLQEVEQILSQLEKTASNWVENK